ncbi:MAG: adenosine deaminase [Elusimicrobia bacterium]|nr:adenosine deaminase [Elusimicrobiota bacterium]
MTGLKDAIKKMPKAELHRHLEGCVRVPTIIDIARRHGLKLPTFDEAGLTKLAKLSGPMGSLAEVLGMFELAQSAFVSYEAVERITFEAMEDAFTKENIRLLELRYSPDFMLKGKGLDWQKALDVMLGAIRDFRRSLPFFCGIIVIASRSYGMESALKTVDFAVKNKGGIIGFDFADDEINYPSPLYAEAAGKLHAAGIPLTVHSGEEGEYTQVLETINSLNPGRIGHGVKSVEDPSGKTLSLIKERGITIETNPFSNYLTRAVKRLEDHPLKKFIKAGVSVSISADDPEILDTDLNKEYLLAVEKIGLSMDDLAYANKCALAASFLPPGIKQEAAKLF